MLKSVINKFNRGVVDKMALSRDDVGKIANTCEIMENWLPLRLGPMVHTPGVEDLGALKDNGCVFPFMKAIDDTALVELTDNALRIWINGAQAMRTDVTSVLPSITAWTQNNGTGSSVSFTGSAANLLGTKTTEACLYHTIAATELNAAHGIRIVVSRGPVKLHIGTSGVGSTDIDSLVLGTGTHSLSVTPTASLTLTLCSDKNYTVIVDSVTLEGAGIVEVPATIGESDLKNVRMFQSGDVIFGTRTGKQFRIERRGKTSWSFVDFETEDGPFGIINTSQITLAPSALTGDITLTASANYFTQGMAGSLIRAVSASSAVGGSFTANGTTDSIRVTGTGAPRQFTISISGSHSGNVILERSADDATWETVRVFDASETTTWDDGLDGAITYYRLRADAGLTGSVFMQLTYPGGAIEGIARIVSVTSGTVANAIVLKDFGATDAVLNWYASQWSNELGYPSALMIYEGRLWFAGKNKLWGSVSDSYASFDRQIEGASRSILRTIGFGPVDNIHWLAAAVRMVLGVMSDEVSLRSSSFGEVLTNDNANLKPGTEQGAANIPPVTANNNIYYVQRSESKLFQQSYNISNDSHSSDDLNYLNQDVGRLGFSRIAMSRQPETRIYCVMQDGSVAIVLMDEKEDVLAWSVRTFPHPCIDVVVLPAKGEDEVYFVLNTGTEYRLQKMANIYRPYLFPVDMFKRSASGLNHLEGQDVDIWVDGVRQASQVVAGGSVTATGANIVVGRKITARYKSNKVGHYVDRSVLGEVKRVVGLGVIAQDLWHGGFKYGRDETKIWPLPEAYKGAPLDLNALINEYDEQPAPFDGEYDVDSRIWLIADGPATIMSLVYDIDTADDPTREAA